MQRVAPIVCCLALSACSCSDRSRVPSASARDASSAPSTLVPPAPIEPEASAPSAQASAAAPDQACPARGELARDWSAPAIADDGAIALTRWRLQLGDEKRASERAFDDAGWEELETPSVRLIATKAKQTTVWLRTTFVVPEGQDPASLSIDLGARTGHTVAYLNGKKAGASVLRNGPVFLKAPLPLDRGTNVLALKLTFGGHVGGVRWSGSPAAGQSTTRRRGLLTRTFQSRVDGSQQTVALFVPRCADLDRPAPLVVALPGWDGNIFGFAHSQMLKEADRRGWLVLVPDPRGNTLYTGNSEEGVLEAIDLVSREARVDPDRLFLTGVSMGGAGALQLSYHFPDKFAAVAAFYGDSRYDLEGYVRPILRDQKTADRYSVMSFHENARNFPVLLVHARDDKVSPFAQSKLLADADARSGLVGHKLIAPERGGHSLGVVEDAVAPMMELFASSTRQHAPPRVSFRTSAARYEGAWWLRVAPRDEGRFAGADVSVDAAARTLRILSVDASASLVRVDLGAAGLKGQEPIVVVVDQAHGPLAFRLPDGWNAVVLHGSASDQRLASDNGVVRVGVLAAGRYELRASN